MPTTQELKRVSEFLNVQIMEAKWEEWEAEEAHLQAEEEAQVAAEKAWREEEECEWEQLAKEEAWACEEEEKVAVERSLHEAGGSSKGKAPQQWLFLSSSESAGSPEEEEKMASPLWIYLEGSTSSMRAMILLLMVCSALVWDRDFS